MFFFVFLFGLAVGSFLNVVIYRLPREESLLFPSSHCPYCGHPLSFFDLIPVLSFIFLKGKCRYCNHFISWRYPVIEVITAFLFLVLYFRFGLSFDFLRGAYFGSFLVAAFFCDAFTGRIPDSLNLGGFIGGVLLNFLPGGLGLRNMLLGALVVGLPLLVLALLGAMGGGDVKLGLASGIYLGPSNGLVMLFLSFILGGLIALLLLFFRRKSLKEKIAFGPFMAMGGLIAFLKGEELLLHYLKMFL